MIRLLFGDCCDVQPTLPAESVQCVVCSPPYYALRSYLDAAHPDKHREIGSEATPEGYLAVMVGVFREVRRVLRRDGTCWVNMGDSYAAGSGFKSNGPQQSRNGNGVCGPRDLHPSAGRANASGFKDYGEAKPKDLLLTGCSVMRWG